MVQLRKGKYKVHQHVILLSMVNSFYKTKTTFKTREFLTFSIGEVAYTEDVVGVGVVVLLDVGRFLRRVLQLHGHFLQLLVQLQRDNRGRHITDEWDTSKKTPPTGCIFPP